MTTSFQDDFHNELTRQALESLGTTDVKIEEYLDSVLRASGSALSNYAMPYTRKALRKAMISVLLDHRDTSAPKPLEVAA